MSKKIFLGLLLLLHLFLLWNLRFEAWPEMILYPWLLSRGFALYQDIINPYLPFLSWMLFLFYKVAGFSIFNLKLFTWTLIILIDLLIFYFSLKFWKKESAAFLSLGFFIFWQPYFNGNGLWFDLAATPFLLLAFYFFVKQKIKKHLLLAGLFLALAFFIKQSVIYFYALALLLLFFKRGKERLRKTALLLLPLLSFLILCIFYFWQKGTLYDFLFWAFKFPFFVLPRMPGHRQLPNLRQLVLTLIPFLPLVFLLNKKASKYWLPLAWFLTAFLFIFPRWGLFHLQPALAFFSILMGKVLIDWTRSLSKKTNFLLLAAIIFVTPFFQVRFYKEWWQRSIRFFEPQVYNLAQWLKENTKEDEAIFNLNAPDQLYFLAKREPVKPWAANYAWYYEAGNLKERVLGVLQEKPPTWIIYQPPGGGGEFAAGTYQPKLIREWIFKNYKLYSKIGETEFLKQHEN